MRYLIFLFLVWAATIHGQDPMFEDISDLAGTGNGLANNGAIVGDFNGDGFEDLFIPSRVGPNRLFKNLGDGTFENVTENSGIETEGLTMTGAWGDIDNDGDLDLFIANYHAPGIPYSNFLYLNDGNGVFTDISTSSGTNTNDQTRSVHMIDLDLDGYLDIYVCNLGQQNVLWKNTGNSTFFNSTNTAGLFDSLISCLLYTSPSPRDRQKSRMPSSA